MNVEFTGQVHPAAAIYPMLNDDALAALADSIRVNGLREPILLDSEGRLLDGRNRLAACGIAGVEPTFAVYEGDDPHELVIDRNVERRQLSSGQQAMARAMHLQAMGARRGGRWEYGSVDSTNPESGKSGAGKTWRNPRQSYRRSLR